MNKKKLLVTGASGMLGQALCACLESRGHDVVPMPKEALDVTNYEQVAKVLGENEPDLVLHCAAYTKVDQAESEPDLAFLINGYGTENLAVVCSKLEIPLLYFSSDYVFDGNNDKPYTTWDPTRPLSVYGRSKLAGEKAVMRHLRDFYIVRTSWLYGPFGRNFVDTIHAKAQELPELKIVSDQVGTPTCTLSLSEMVADLISTGRYGVYHATDDGVTNWYDFAREICKGLDVTIKPIPTKEYPLPATRPSYSVLDKTTLISTIGREPQSWQESLHNYLELKKVKATAAKR